MEERMVERMEEQLVSTITVKYSTGLSLAALKLCTPTYPQNRSGYPEYTYCSLWSLWMTGQSIRAINFFSRWGSSIVIVLRVQAIPTLYFHVTP